MINNFIYKKRGPLSHPYFHFNLICLGDTHGEVEEHQSQKQYRFHTSMVLPMSTFAIAIGDFEVLDIPCDDLPVRLIGCKTDLSAVHSVKILLVPPKYQILFNH